MDSDSDGFSTFSYDDENIESDSFSLIELKNAVSSHIGQHCSLSKIAQGGYHKVYDIYGSDGELLNKVTRVASPAFPRDKLESEVATLKYVLYFTKVPVPKVYYWNSDAANPVGAEYMIMEKVHGVPASKIWDDLHMDKKRTVVSDIASVPFYRALDGEPRVPVEDWNLLREEQASFRGPFNKVTDFLLCAVRAELNFLKHHRPYAEPSGLRHPRGAEAAVEEGEEVLRQALDLYPLFPGDLPVYSPMSSPEEPFSICLDDFRLSNIMIDPTTGKVTGLFDLEGTTIAPVWACAAFPGWLVEEDHEDWLPGDESDDIRAQLRETFMDAIKEADPSGEWDRAQSAGRPYRYLLNASKYFVVPWGNRKAYVNSLLEWCKANPGKIYTGPVDPSECDPT
ncbi:phosphotransferase enzyme family protein [Ceratobasidium sp. AG-Ba]|nr:phosphotransferase enzyme family protein [Ceratobasidium sp. AG-Ba]